MLEYIYAIRCQRILTIRLRLLVQNPSISMSELPDLIDKKEYYLIEYI